MSRKKLYEWGDMSKFDIQRCLSVFYRKFDDVEHIPISHPNCNRFLSTAIVDDEIERLRDCREMISIWLSQLTERRRKVLVLRYGLEDEYPHTLAAVGLVLNLIRERVRQIERRALEEIRRMHP